MNSQTSWADKKVGDRFYSADRKYVVQILEVDLKDAQAPYRCSIYRFLDHGIFECIRKDFWSFTVGDICDGIAFDFHTPYEGPFVVASREEVNFTSSRRDMFAAAALTGLLATVHESEFTIEGCVKMAWRAADEMMKP